MSWELLLAFVGFAFATSITPGPNNIMLMASGVNFGLRRSLPHVAGIAGGFFVMLVLVGLGLGQVLRAWPAAYLVLKFASLAYMLWFAWKIATAGRAKRGKEAGGAEGAGARPITALQAALFQWVNPKAWMMTVTAAAVYTVPSDYLASLLTISVLFVAVGTPCMGVWTVFGVALRSFLADPVRLRAFNIAMAVLLVVSFLPILFDAAAP